MYCKNRYHSKVEMLRMIASYSVVKYLHNAALKCSRVKICTAVNSPIHPCLGRLSSKTCATFSHSLQFSHFRILQESVRFKTKKAKGYEKRLDEEDFSDDEDEFENDEFKHSEGQLKKLMLKSLRCDNVIKSLSKLSKRKLEEAFIGNKITLNGRVMNKKGRDVKDGDIIEVFSGENLDSNDKNESSITYSIKKIVPLEQQMMYNVFIEVKKS